MKFQELLMANKDRKVLVTYSDNKGNHETTVKEIGDRFLQESPEWKQMFFETLLREGIATTRMGGTYELI